MLVPSRQASRPVGTGLLVVTPPNPHPREGFFCPRDNYREDGHRLQRGDRGSLRIESPESEWSGFLRRYPEPGGGDTGVNIGEFRLQFVDEMVQAAVVEQ